MFDAASRSASGLPIGELVDAIAEESGQIAAAQCRMLLKLAEFDAREDAAFAWDCKSAAHWLSGRCGYDMAASWEMVRVARRLRSLPAITEAFGKGQLNYHAVKALVRIPTPETEADMVEMARVATGSQLGRIVSSYRRVLASYADAKAPFAGRELHWFFDAEGFFCLKGRLPAEAGTVLRQALEAAAAQLRADDAESSTYDVADDQPPGRARIPAAANRADALVAMAESSLARGLQSRAGSDATQVIVHVSAETLAGTGEGEHCEIEDGAEIAPETARRLACDAAVVGLVEDASGEVLSMGRKTRKVSPAMARALRCRDKGCVFPGCGQTRFVQAHHITHWAHGGETSLENLTQLCWFHHHLIHEGGFGLARDKESKSLVFSRPDGAVIDRVRIETGPHDGQLDLGVDVGYGAKRTDRIHVECNDVMRFFSRNDRRIPKLPRGRPPDPEPNPE
jgi:hypothetical protein